MIVLWAILLAVHVNYCRSILFLRKGLLSLPESRSPQNRTFTILIAARNEEENISACLDACGRQTISEDRYEIIVVNDRSTDGTAEICAGYPRVKLINIDATPDGFAPKKYAVTRGIEAANNEIIVMTDADCIVPATWLAAMDRFFSDKNCCVQGITTYAEPENAPGMMYNLQATDFLSHGIVAASAIGAGMPINSNANNFAFTKKAFEAVGGYSRGPEKIVSGDDDLLLQRLSVSGLGAVGFMTDPEGAVTTKPTDTLRGVFEQRKRWGSKTIHYGKRQIRFLAGIYVFYLCIIACFAASMIDPVWLVGFGAMLCAKIAGECALMIPGTALFKKKELRAFILPASLLQLPMVILAVFMGVFGSFSWKGEVYKRKVS
ncbi:MAG: glycosyltransferase [Chitinispirillaceae bacterium]|jgi:cellulose synthase/poly-beta-1,6-N-acetylglucosamine synthase-like glycosyltransferase|nr:glycosyltransferase [Chitinispirillaceae bacterium]